MTVAAKPSIRLYLGDGVTTTFTADFRFKAGSTLAVELIAADGTVSPLTYGVGFTATGGSTDAGGSVTCMVAPAAGVKVRIRRATPLAQTSTWTTGDRFPAKETEDAHDTAMLVAQELSDTVTGSLARALRVPEGETAAVVPAPRLNVGKFLAAAAGGALVWASGTGGGDAALRGDLAAGAGAQMVGSVAPWLAAEVRNQADINNERVSLLDFWKAIDADYTNAASRANAYANATGGNKTITVPTGRFAISGTPTRILTPHVLWRGLGGSSGSVIDLSYNGDFLIWGNAGVSGSIYGGGCEDMMLSYASTPGTSARCFLQDGADGQNFYNLRFEKAGRILQMGTATSTGYGVTAGHWKGNVANIGVPAVKTFSGAGFFIHSYTVYVAGVPNPAANRTSSMVVVSGRTFIENTPGYTFDTICVGAVCSVERYWRCYNFITLGTGDYLLNVFVNPTGYHDYIADDCVHLEAAAGVFSGGIFACKFGGHMNSWSANTVSVTGGGAIQAVDLIELKSDFAGKNGLLIDNENAADITLFMGRLPDCDRLNATGLDPGGEGAKVAAVSLRKGDRLKVIRTRGGHTFGSNWIPANGIYVAPELGVIEVTGSDFAGATKAWNMPRFTTNSGNRICRLNINALYAGWQPNSGIWTLPATGVQFVNMTAWEVWVSLAGLTSASATLNGEPAGTGFPLMPGDTFVPTYTGSVTNPWAKVLP